MAKSEVIIDTKIDTSEVNKGAENINKKLTEVGRKTEQTAKKMSNAMKDALNVSTPTEEYAQFEKRVGTLAKAMENVAEKQKKFLEEGGSTNDEEYIKLTRTLEILQTEQSGVIDKMKEMTASSTGVKLDTGAAKEAEALGSEAVAAGEASGAMTALVGASAALAVVAGTVVVGFKAVTTVLSAVKTFATKVFNVLRDGFKKVVKYVSSMINLSSIFDKVVSYTKEGIENLASFNNGINPVNDNLSTLKSSLTQLKNSFATAFSPILTVVTPILNSLISTLTDAVTALGMFFAKLTGASTFTKATQVNQKYADATQDAADAQAALNEELAGYDKLSVISQNSATKNASTIGGSGIAFETVQIEGLASDWADKIKEAWSKADFTEIGETVRDLIINKLNNIDWNSVQGKATQFGKSVGSFMAGLLKPDKMGNTVLGSIGSALAESVNTAIKTFNGWEEAFSKNGGWTNLGKNVADALNKFFKGTDWDLAAETIAKITSGLGTSFLTAVDKIEFDDIGSKLGTGLQTFFDNMNKKEWVTIDGETMLLNGWQKWGKGFSKLADGLLTLFSTAVSKVNWNEVGQAIGDFITSIDWATLIWDWTLLATQILVGIVSAVGAIASSIWQGIKDAIFGPSPEGGGHSIDIPIETPFAETAATLKQKWDTLTANISDKVAEIKAKIATKADEFKTKWNAVVGNVKDKAAEFKASVATKATEFKKKWDTVVGNAKNKTAEFRAKVASKAKEFKDSWNAVVGNVQDKTASFKAKVATKWSNLSSDWSKITDNIKGKTAEMKAKLASKWDDLKGEWSKITDNIKDKTVKITVALQELATSVFKSSWNKLADALNNAIVGWNTLQPINALKISARVPKLATGAVIPPNKEFLAMLGDQKHGTNIEAPLDTIVQAMQIALGGNGGNNQPIQIVLDGKVVAQTVWDETQKKYKQTGYRPGYGY